MRAFHLRIRLKQGKNYKSTPNNDTFYPTSLFCTYPAHNLKPTARRTGSVRHSAGRDYRLGPISIDWVDFEAMSVSAGKEKLANQNTPVASFVPFTSGSTNLPDGVVRIYRDGPGTAAPVTSVQTSQAQKAEGPPDDAEELEYDTVAVLAVPPWMTPSDFLAFVAPAAESMAHLRLIHDSLPNRTMVIIQFRDASSAAEFIENFNGVSFNSIEPETCNVVRVKSIEIETEDPASPLFFRSTSSATMYELPTCPVCLDRMDSSVTGLVTVPCSHTFHCMCLSKWGDSRCPVCRYSQNALISHQRSSSFHRSGTTVVPDPHLTGLTSCFDCNSRFNLWICLICGNIGCGRQGRAHAKGHYELTSHLYALELETQRVWDYAGDNYVHRLIQNKADGSLVELPSASNIDNDSKARQHLGPGVDDDLKAEKVEIMAMQYSQILQRAMDDQRRTYEEQVSDLQKKMEELTKKFEIISTDNDLRALRDREEREQRRRDEDIARERLEKEKAKLEKKADRLTELAKSLEKELKEERAVSNGLMSNLTKLKEKAEVIEKERQEARAEIEDLKEQLRDIMFYMQAQEKIAQADGALSEAAGGSVEVRQSGVSKKKKKGS